MNNQATAQRFAKCLNDFGYGVEAQDIVDWLNGESTVVTNVAKDALGSHSLMMFNAQPHTVRKLEKLVETVLNAD